MDKKGAPCAFCGRWVEPSTHIHRGRIEYHQKKYCSKDCYRKAMSKKMMGRTYSEQTIKKMSEARKKLFAEGKLIPNWKGKSWTAERIIKIMAIKRGIKLDSNDIINLGKIERLPKATRAERMKEHQFATAETLRKLSSLGFKCSDLTKRPLPDGIAIKNGEVFAVEVEHCFVNPAKYRGDEFYDDVLWVVYGRTKNREAFVIRNSKLLKG